MLNGFLELAEEQEIISFDWQSFSSNWSATAAFVLPVKNARQRSNNSSFSDLIVEQGGYRPSDAINACSKSISDKTNFYSSITFVDNKRFLATGKLVQSIEGEREKIFLQVSLSVYFHRVWKNRSIKREPTKKEKKGKKNL